LYELIFDPVPDLYSVDRLALLGAFLLDNAAFDRINDSIELVAGDQPVCGLTYRVAELPPVKPLLIAGGLLSDSSPSYARSFLTIESADLFEIRFASLRWKLGGDPSAKGVRVNSFDTSLDAPLNLFDQLLQFRGAWRVVTKNLETAQQPFPREANMAAAHTEDGATLDGLIRREPKAAARAFTSPSDPGAVVSVWVVASLANRRAGRQLVLLDAARAVHLHL
jgi:hypothetical protein